MQTATVAATRLDGLDDGALVALARNRDGAAVRLIMQRHNRRLFRVARGVLHDEAEAEDVVQETDVRAFTHLDGFRGKRSSRLGSRALRSMRHSDGSDVGASPLD